VEESKKIVIISDGTGKTAKRLMDSVLAQYSIDEVEFSLINIYQEVRDKKKIDKLLNEIHDDYLVVFSIISESLARYMHEKLSRRAVLHLNVLEPMLNTMSKFLGVHPDYQPGILQIIDDRYYKKVDAIGFTVEHDDGQGHLTGDADIILLGLSRTCKTPISMYLACNYGLKVANIPIFPGNTMEPVLSSRLVKAKHDHIFGLLMQPEILMHVREERLAYLARTSSSQLELKTYYDLRDIRAELRFCRELFGRKKWKTIDVTRRAIEEISMELLEKIGLSPYH